MKADFSARMTIRDVNEFVDGYEHEAQLSGSIHLAQFEELGDATFAMDAANSRSTTSPSKNSATRRSRDGISH